VTVQDVFVAVADDGRADVWDRKQPLREDRGITSNEQIAYLLWASDDATPGL
jgi:hypothetical protein